MVNMAPNAALSLTSILIEGSVAVEPGQNARLPAGWRLVAAGDIGRFRGGNGFALHLQGERATDLPFYKVSDMNNAGNDTFMVDANHWISEAARRRMGATVFPKNSIVFAKVGAAVFLERKKILSRPSCIDNNLCAFIFDEDSNNVRFLHYVLLKTRLGDLVSTTALPSLSGTVLRQVPLLLPPRPEQEAIATALSDVDALLLALEALIAKKRNLKVAAMQELLTGKTRLPGFGGEWLASLLGALADVEKGQQLNAEYLSPTGRYPHFNGGITASGYTDRHNTPAGSIAISEGGNSCGFVQFIAEPFWRGGHCYGVKPNVRVHQGFLYHALKKMQADIMGLRVGSGLPNVQKSALVRVQVVLPKAFDEQAAIATVLTDMDAELSALEARVAKTRLLKLAMMQDLLTGRTRLP